MSKTVYFGYGSNFWLDQMKRRCPESRFIGIGRLDHWKWIINVRGYANIIPSHGDVVYGLMYELSAADEHDLDLYEGPTYAKKILSLTTHKSEIIAESVEALTYIDELRKSESHPRTEYIYRMNMGIADALEMGIPQEYVEKYLRPFIPSSDNPALGNEN
ncbi:hypothetical protein BDN70DRAFT_797258 [Pholiota conissans]|uniref:gamma-glutamylcyclotransferase n=1 Tax=Pholiota conissans TaxID=109636 RepID=A0A9P6D691_9AGAR|nr:hypothetical protein BDN70DRAFT_797258 [Pholiota conissans]